MPRTSREANWVNRKKLRRHVDTGNSEMADAERFSRRWKYRNHGKRKTETLNQKEVRKTENYEKARVTVSNSYGTWEGTDVSSPRWRIELDFLDCT